MAGSIATYTTHTISAWGDGENEEELVEVFIDSDKTARLKFEGNDDRTSRWMDKADLLKVRAAINRALRLM